ncbi:hypothetical protein GCM10017744_079830 [Streptomyces antimycoticus]|uniref:Uncharacterized protein n=1 Tax=Streptomyces antimycoticus TaxID=68175 RepID=A0A4D4K3R4_9ACTN|nr:hypothetical protein [Streptomyces antimycoticus]GDY41268.1 hypothetical protein SANT12839_021500 [Streptomyces antimycoticus]
MDVIVMAEGDIPTGLARKHRYREPVEEALLAEHVDVDAFGSYHDPAARAAREVWNG